MPRGIQENRRPQLGIIWVEQFVSRPGRFVPGTHQIVYLGPEEIIFKKTFNDIISEDSAVFNIAVTASWIVTPYDLIHRY
jgi:hypothetical protein